MPGIKELKTRIKSVHSMRKITRAMQMVSAAKMRKAQMATISSRRYSSLAWELILNLRGNNPLPHQPKENEEEELWVEDEEAKKAEIAMEKMGAMLQTFPDAKKIAVFVLTSNTGLVGSLNTNLINTAKKLITTSELDVDVITYGRKGEEAIVRSGKSLLADFEKVDKTLTTEDVLPVSTFISDLYQSGTYQKIYVIYNHYVSTLVQKPTVKQLLPFAKAITEKPEGEEVSIDNSGYNYIFEPEAQTVFSHLLPRIIESQLYQAMLEGEASEHSARMIMMKNATEAAEDLISDLTLTYNKLRQGKITTELAEITAGKIALE
jgi:F-type H+-transporting ATPase subunit gamma